jgi:riboflavin kinase/FMN adenylyltransferase
MRIVRTLRQPPEAVRGAAVALGNFDGIHRGHQAVISAARKVARKLGAPPAVLTFEPHPRRLFRPGDPPFRLTPLRAKARVLRELGVDVLFVARFDRAFSRTPAEEFVRGLLARDLRARHVIAGHDFVFGHDRGGDADLLQRLAAGLGLGVTIVDAVAPLSAPPFASRLVREALANGAPEDAAAALGRWWDLGGRVQHGAARGRRLGYPTANVPLAGDVLRPKFGVYAVRVRVDADPVWHDGVASFGVQPMFGGGEPVLEAHLFDVDADLYGRQVCVAVVAYLRPEEDFASLDALRVAMDGDSARARAILADPAYASARFTGL